MGKFRGDKRLAILHLTNIEKETARGQRAHECHGAPPIHLAESA